MAIIVAAAPAEEVVVGAPVAEPLGEEVLVGVELEDELLLEVVSTNAVELR